VIGIAFLFQALVGYVDAGLRVPIRHGAVQLLAAAAIFAWRIFFSAHVLRVVAPIGFCWWGQAPCWKISAKHIEEHPETGLQVVGMWATARKRYGHGRRQGPPAPWRSLSQIIQATNPDRIVVGMTERRGLCPSASCWKLRFAATSSRRAASTYEKVCGRVCLKELRPRSSSIPAELGRVAPACSTRRWQT